MNFSQMRDAASLTPGCTNHMDHGTNQEHVKKRNALITQMLQKVIISAPKALLWHVTLELITMLIDDWIIKRTELN